MYSSLGFLLSIIAVAISCVSSLSCQPCHEHMCSATTACKGGFVKDVCGCCDVCAKLEGEECGGEWDMHGKCSRGLRCVQSSERPFGSGVCKPDKCANKKCPPGEICAVVAGKATCSCPSSCKHTRRPVCEIGTGREFINVCFLKKYQCQTGQTLEYTPGPCRKCFNSGAMYKTGETIYKKRNCQTCSCRNGSWKCKSKCQDDEVIPCKVSMTFNELVCPSGMKCVVDVTLGEKVPGICVPAVGTKNDKGSAASSASSDNAHTPTQPPQEPVRKDICQQPAAQGPCSSTKIRWYYNSEASDCLKFYYGGCLGNSNNFMSREDCRQRCKKEDSDEKKEACTMTPHHGPCNEKLKRWFFNRKTGKCEPFMYGGCGANANNFLTRKQCNHICKGRDPK